MNKRRLAMLAVLLLLFGLAALLSMSGDPAKPVGPAVEFPREMTPEARRRSAARRTHAVELASADGTHKRVVKQDPLLASLPRGPGRTAVVLEANAIRNSPLGEMLLTCMDGARVAELAKERSGIDLLQDLDRVAITGDGMTISGNFGAADWDALLPPEMHRANYGEGGRIYSLPTPAGRMEDGGRPESIAIWGDSFVVVGSEDELQRTIDRLEGRGEEGPPAIDESQAYGEVYGVVGSEDLARFFGEGEKTAGLAEALLRAGSTMELHADTRGDVGMVARFAGEDPALVRDLGKTMGGLLSAARLEAMTSGNADAVRLLDMASLDSGDGDFNLEVALPQTYLAELAARCAERRAKRQENRERAMSEWPAEAPEASPFEPAPSP